MDVLEQLFEEFPCSQDCVNKCSYLSKNHIYGTPPTCALCAPLPSTPTAFRSGGNTAFCLCSYSLW